MVMKTGTIALISILTIGIIVMIVVIVIYQSANTAANQHNILYPFSAAIQPGNKTVFLKNAAGQSQIDCSAVGGKINIVAAWSEVADLYGECSGESSSALNLSCGIPGAKIACKEDSDCGPGMQCAGGLCKPAICKIEDQQKGTFDSSKCSCGGNYCPIRPGTTCTTLSDCDPSGTGTLMTCNTTTKKCEVNPGQSCMAPDITGQFCAIYPLCSNRAFGPPNPSNSTQYTSNFVNKVCNPNNTVGIPGQQGVCRPRDASAYLAAKCDGKSTCVVEYDPENPLSGFGPRPCDSSVSVGSTAYKQLPNIPSTGGNYIQSYYVHGLYACLPQNS